MNSGAQHKRAPDAPQQRFVLALPADPEPFKQNQEDEEIVDAERGLDGVAGHELERRLPAHGYGNPAGKAGRGQRHPCGSQPGEDLRVPRLAPVAGQHESATSTAATTA